LLVALLLAGSVAAGPQSELKELRSRIRELQKQLADSEEVKSEAADALRDTERGISETNRRLFEIGDARQAAQAELKQINSRHRALQTQVSSQQRLLSELLYQQYVAGQDEPVRLLLNRQDPNLLARRMQYLGYVSRARAGMIAQIRSDLSELADLATRAESKNAELVRLEQDQAAERARLESEQREHRKVLAEVSRQISSQRHEIGTLKRDEARLTRLVKRLARTLEARNRPPREARPRTEHLPDPGLAGPFASLKGRLGVPVQGELANRFGSPRQGGGPPWKGVLIKADAGDPVRAVAAGRVVFADWLRGFGNLLILDHGAGYMSLYAYNEALYRQVGDAVSAGDPIAVVGRSGGSPETGLYFEIRFQGEPLDPLAWIRLK